MSKKLNKLVDINGLREFKNKTGSVYVQTGEVDQTVGGTKTFPKPIVGSVTGSSGSCTGNAATATTAGAVSTLVADGSAKDVVHAYMAGSDAFRIRCGGSGDNGYVEIATSDNGNESIYVRQYHIDNGNGGDFTTIARTLTLLDGSGNTRFPGTVTATAFYGNITGNVTGNCSGSSGSCTGNAATATKLATARTIALSGAATGTATGFDGSGNITIPVTALSGSAITSAISIYDLVPDGAANHRNFYRGKDITAAFNNGTVSANIANGTFRDIFPGDYITKNVTVAATANAAAATYTIKFIIADLDIWLHRGDTSCETHHVAIVPETPPFSSYMNTDNVTTGGYVGSYMNQTVIPAFATGLQNAFGASHLISFRIGLSNGVTTTTASASHPYWTGTSNWWGAWTSEICCLMSEGMVHGQSPNHSAAMDETMCGQFAAFRLNSNLVYNHRDYWLSDVASSAFFARAGGVGYAFAGGASYSFGVRPFALLK